MVEIIWLGRIFSFGGAHVNFLYTLMDIRKILKGPWPPQGAKWLRPWLPLRELEREEKRVGEKNE